MVLRRRPLAGVTELIARFLFSDTRAPTRAASLSEFRKRASNRFDFLGHFSEPRLAPARA